MLGLPGTVFAGIPHHITRRGNRRNDVFFNDEDRKAYLLWLKEYSEKGKVEVLAYYLITYYVYLVAVPKTVDSLPGYSKSCICAMLNTSTGR
jgi:putative transposase